MIIGIIKLTINNFTEYIINLLYEFNKLFSINKLYKSEVLKDIRYAIRRKYKYEFIIHKILNKYINILH